MNIVKERRQELGYTQEQMADLIGLKNKRSYSNFEQGIRSLQSQKILQLSKILGLGMEEIMLIRKGVDVKMEKWIKRDDIIANDSNLEVVEEVATGELYETYSARMFIHSENLRDTDPSHPQANYGYSLIKH